jgi:parallel beta-helix repeat protein
MLLLWLTISIATLPNSLSTSRDGTVGVDDNPLESAHVDPMPSLTAVPLVAYESHDSISIYSDSDFSTQGWPGSGTQEAPYVIEGLEIVTDYTCIRVSGTSVHFVIRNCLFRSLEPTEHQYGVRLQNVNNGSVANCTISFKGYGVYGLSCSDLRIVNNTIHDNPNKGIRISQSSNCEIISNSVCNVTGDGLYLSSSQNCNLVNNTIWNNSEDGLYISDSECTVANNTAFNNLGDGIAISESSNVIVTNNTAFANSDSGVYGYYAENCTFSNNTVYQNQQNGFDMTRSVDSLVVNNTIHDNAMYGLEIRYSPNCTVSDNIFQNNGLVVGGAELADWMLNVVDNSVNGKALGYFTNMSDAVIDGYQYGQAILVNCTRVTLRDGIFDAADIGIAVYYSSNCTVNSTSVSDNYIGIWLYSTNSSNVVDNTLVNNGIVVTGWDLSNWIHNFTGNLVNSKPLGYFLNQSALTIDGSAYGQVIVVNCTDILVEDGVFLNASQGIALVFSPGSELINNTVTDSYYGIRILDCSGSHFENNTISGSLNTGFLLYDSNQCSLTNNTWESNYYGLYVYNSMNCSLNTSTIRGGRIGIYPRQLERLNVSYNLIEYTYYGIYTYDIEDCTMNDNIVSNNSGYGAYLFYADRMILLNNTFEHNANHGAYLTGSFNASIRENTFRYNGMDGVSIWSSDNCRVINNTASYNSNYGIMLHHNSDNTTVYGNIIVSNVIGNGYGYQSSNTWDDGVSRGNYWSDYYGPGEYSIPGPGGNVDRYPSGPTQVADHSDIQYHLGTTGHSITWVANSGFPDAYAVFLNGTEIDSGAWDGSSVTVSIDGRPVGVFNYTLLVNDTLGEWARDSVMVTVYDLVPTIDSPSDREYHLDTTGHSITWTPSDLNPDSYEVYGDHNMVQSGNWDGSAIAVSVDGLSIGVHNYTVVVNDTSGNMAKDTVLVNVWDLPPELDSPSDLIFEVGTTGNNIFWNASDYNPDTYVIFMNDSLVDSGTWDGLPITFSVDGLSTGAYSYSIRLNDTSDNYATDTVLVTVTPAATTTPTTTTPTTGTTPTTSTEPPPDLTGMMMIFGIGASVVIIIVIVVMLKGKRR